MNEKKKNVIPKSFFSTLKNTITSREALKNVIPVNWNETLKNRDNNSKQIIKLKNQSYKQNN